MKGMRHFPYKHPTFGTKSRPKPESAWKCSVYYWWWEYLRRNVDYQIASTSADKGKFAALFDDFGALGDDFQAWWRVHGVHLFAEPPAEDSVKVLEQGEIVPNGTLTITFPLNLPKKHLEKRFKELLMKEHQGKRGRQMAKLSQARYRFKGQPNLHAIELGLRVYDHRIKNPGMPLWQVGNTLENFLPLQKIRKTDTPAQITDKKNALAATVCRYIKRVEKNIQHAGEGTFL